WAGNAVAVAAIVSGIGALGGWTMICAEMPYAAAREGLFPKAFARKRGDTPVFGILAATVLASLITVAAYSSFDHVFTTIVLLSVLTAAIPYLFSAAAQLFWLLTHAHQASRGRFVRDVAVSGTALAFSYWSIQGSGYQTVYYGLFAVLLGIPVYILLKRDRGEYGEQAGSSPSAPPEQLTSSDATPTPQGRAA
uniref:amino acid permease n=1 Tax=Embleya scabrispora TaxID=159449 RepID=UPI0003823AA8